MIERAIICVAYDEDELLDIFVGSDNFLELTDECDDEGIDMDCVYDWAESQGLTSFNPSSSDSDTIELAVWGKLVVQSEEYESTKINLDAVMVQATKLESELYSKYKIKPSTYLTGAHW